MNEDDIQIDHEDENLDDSVVAEEHMGDTVKKLREKLKAAEEKAKEHLDNWQRAQADFVNLRKRDEEAKADYLKFAEAKLIEELVPVLDSLSLAVSHGDPTRQASGAGKGVEQIYTLLLKILKQHGVEELNPENEAFDPSEHEAVGMIPVNDKSKDHTVMSVFQRGYALNGKVIRPAKVQIGEYRDQK